MDKTHTVGEPERLVTHRTRILAIQLCEHLLYQLLIVRACLFAACLVLDYDRSLVMAITSHSS